MPQSNSANLQQAFTKRRSIYALGGNLPVKSQAIIDIAERTILNTPSAFNSQTTRLVVLFGKQHKQLWDITETHLRKAVGSNDFSGSKQKMDGFRAAVGTVMFYEDKEVIQSLQDKFELYADRFPIWAQQTSAMHQYAMWLELSALNIGANLQHYNPLINNDIASAFSIPKQWELVAQMPFGNIVEPAGEKIYQSASERIRVFGL